MEEAESATTEALPDTCCVVRVTFRCLNLYNNEAKQPDGYFACDSKLLLIFWYKKRVVLSTMRRVTEQQVKFEVCGTVHRSV